MKRYIDIASNATYNVDIAIFATQIQTNTMNEEKRFYLTAAELSDLMGISIGHAYKLIRDMNAELAKEGYIVVAGKVPKRYVEKRCYGYTLQ